MDILKAIDTLNRLVFTTQEIAALTASSTSSTNQKLNRLEQKGLIGKIKRGLWGRVHDRMFNQFMVIPFLETHHQSYLSFTSAMHQYGIISQIPQAITIASTAHSKKITTSVGTFYIHQIAPDFFDGFDWSKNHTYLIATPEKALIDCFYLSSRRGNQFSHFPEIDLKNGFKISKAKEWAKKIPDQRIRLVVLEKLKVIWHLTNSR
ncbi:hypothetical protein KKA47_02550 [bacterium]|nr:hypothetical protein [bacterium]